MAALRPSHITKLPTRTDGHVETGPPIALRIGSGRWLVRSPRPDASLRSVLERPDAFLLDPAMYFKHSRNVTVARLPRPGNRGWVLRRLNYGKLRHRLRDSFRPSRARRAFWIGLRLEEAGVAIARVLAVGETRRLRWPVCAYLLTEEIPGAITLAGLLEQKHPQMKRALRRLAEVLARLHDAGFSHRDLKATNVLFDDQLQAHLIDLDGVRAMRFGAQRRAVADLTRLVRDVISSPAFSTRYVVLFLQTYCQRRGLVDWRPWWEQIAARLRAEG
jgi:tRNA A-37 threonylcarbamoyl transferase component Bud32